LGNMAFSRQASIANTCLIREADIVSWSVLH
jgi:hypothetical protein